MCVKEGIQCSNPYGVHLKDQYTDYIMECKDHILSKPVMLDSITLLFHSFSLLANLVCYQDRIFKNEVQAHRRLQQTHQYCSFTSYACVNEELEFVNDEATFYVATCEDHTLHGPQRMAGISPSCLSFYREFCLLSQHNSNSLFYVRYILSFPFKSRLLL